MDSSAAGPPLGKYLASSDKSVRDKAIKNLSAFLSNNSQEFLSKDELAKLWKGIFYCYWMSDKPLVQQALASELANLVLTIPTTAASLSFLETFWEATVREWSRIDRLRLDKYYMLIRRFTNATFRLLKRDEWKEDVCMEYNSILTAAGRPLCSEDGRVPSSLSYHLADIYLEELNKVVNSVPSCPPVPICTILSPFIALAARTPSKITYKRLESSLFDPLFSDLARASSTSLDNPSSEIPGERKQKRSRLLEPTFEHLIRNCRNDESQTVQSPQELRKTILQRIFDVASQQETRDSNRRKMYAIWKEGMEDLGEPHTTS